MKGSLSEKKWFTWLMLFLVSPYGIYLLLKNREQFPNTLPYVVGCIFAIPYLGILFTEGGVWVLLTYSAALLLFAGIVGIIKGSVSSLKISNRKVAGITFVVGFVAFLSFGNGLPEAKQTQAIIDEETQVNGDSSTDAKPVTNIDETVAKPPSSSKQQETKKNEDEDMSSTSSIEEKEEPEKDTTVTVASEPNGEMSVHFVDVGQGSAQVIITPSGKTMVIDSGNNDDEDDMVAYLANLGVKRVDYLIGSHPDADHIGGMDAVIDSYDIGEIYMPKISANTQTFESVLQSIKNKGLKVKTGTQGISLDIGDGITADFLAPIGSSSDRNEMSIVVKVTYGENSFLFTGDADERSESEMITQYGTKLDSTVLAVGHHGSNGSSTSDFLERVKPSYAVIQVGKNSYGHPTPEVLERLNNVGAEIYRNDEQGTIIFTSNGYNVKVNTNAWEYKAPKTKPKTEETTKEDSETAPAATPTPPPVEEKPKAKQSLSAAATISNATPTQNSNLIVSVTVKDGQGNAVSGAEVTLTLHYKSTETIYTGVTGANGVADISFRIGRAAKGFTVDGDINVTANGLTTHTSTAFTPQ
ncbi:MBL fold metallo-hydrolase [Bacillus sp. RO1]|uniref:MBL fold metallo-hydrolase n=1 Tax=Bacillus sp. RO1 TaxID=2722703 RepID=UPI001457083C|nr:MBL fold metallo-hydrolase [Bacillus sp. RO1]NLP52049.1 MBL fold metallo-hydrolase [Bacillus sp. RO1]